MNILERIDKHLNEANGKNVVDGKFTSSESDSKEYDFE